MFLGDFGDPKTTQYDRDRGKPSLTVDPHPWPTLTAILLWIGTIVYIFTHTYLGTCPRLLLAASWACLFDFWPPPGGMYL